jgi:translation initiation factor 2 beta subunit (eIF-2beta)/eIF-5
LLDRFKERHIIVYRSISGKSAVLDTDICDDWLKNKLPNLVNNYKACDIFNAEETRLFYKLMPNKTLQLKGEKCHGGKKSKDG